MKLRAALAAIPDVDVPRSVAVEAAIADSVRYLGSDEALASLAVDVYWPKWNAPWWHMVLLWELGEARRIPASAARAMVSGLNALRLRTFPIRPEEWPADANRWHDASCHCALGTIDQVLAACGVDVDAELPWIAAWYPRYQMRDGGLNCDDAAYLVEGECPSSMVGTAAPFEAMLRRGDGAFIERAAALLLQRELRLGSSTTHNAEERASEPLWALPTFPRFYFYDLLRGLTAITRWATELRRPLPEQAIAAAAFALAAQSPDGIVRVGRRAFDAHGTVGPGPDGVWKRLGPASSFPLLEATGVVGAPSAALTAEWRRTRAALVRLLPP